MVGGSIWLLLCGNLELGATTLVRAEGRQEFQKLKADCPCPFLLPFIKNHPKPYSTAFLQCLQARQALRVIEVLLAVIMHCLLTSQDQAGTGGPAYEQRVRSANPAHRVSLHAAPCLPEVPTATQSNLAARVTIQPAYGSIAVRDGKAVQV